MFCVSLHIEVFYLSKMHAIHVFNYIGNNFIYNSFDISIVRDTIFYLFIYCLFLKPCKSFCDITNHDYFNSANDTRYQYLTY